MKRSVLFLCLAIAGRDTRLSAQVWSLQGPASRHSHSAVFDPTSQQMIIFGGQQTGSTSDLNDTWLGVTASNQNDSFAQLLPTGTLPSARYGHIATYDSSSNRMTIFGGASGSPISCDDDVWILSGANGQSGTPSWTEARPSGTPPAARVYAAGVYDPTSNSMIVFGGSNCSTGYFNDVWVLSGANGQGSSQAWTQLATSGTPPAARESASAIYDSVNNILTIYAGDAGASPFSDVWVLSHANGNGGTPTWTQLSPSGVAPVARTGQSATYDSVNNRMTIFGGVNGSSTLTDSWILTAANGIGSPGWISLSTTGTAPSLAYDSAVYSQAADEMFVFGGTSTADKLQPQSHAFTLTDANGLANVAAEWVLGGPAVRYAQTAFYDSVTNNWFVWGGQHASASNLNFNDYWQATNIVGSSNLQWNKLLESGSVPSARYGQTGLYDSGSNRLMIFGGSNGKCKNDYHVLQYANYQGGTPTWVSVTPSGTAPAARALQASAYDSGTNTLILFGGFNCKSTYYNDVWVANNANDVSTKPSWTKLSPSGTGPGVRESATVVYDPTTNALILYGGDAGGAPFGDIWLLSYANGAGGTPSWTQLQPSNGGPVARSGHTAIYDSVNNRMTIYGGYNGTNVLSDVWILSNANGKATPSWSQSTSGDPRRFASASYDALTNEMITFGGASDVNPQDPTSDLHILTLANGLP